MIPNIFIQHASDILGATDYGLTNSQIARLCASYSIDFNTPIPYAEYPFQDVPNKRTALKKNLEVFSPEHLFRIIKELCELEHFKGNPKVKDLKIKLFTRYGHFNTELDSVNEMLIDETKHWLDSFDDVLSLYDEALLKFKNNIFERNLLDDLRLALEKLLKHIFKNSKSLENQISDLGAFISSKGGSKELANMFQKLVDYYSKYQNSYVKHDDKVIEEEIEFMFELTSSFMKHLIRINNK